MKKIVSLFLSVFLLCGLVVPKALAYTPTLEFSTLPDPVAYQSQSTEGTGYVTFEAVVSDESGNGSMVKVEYSDDDGATWYDPILESVTPDSGEADFSNDNEYQIGTDNKVDTNNGDVTLTIVWDTKSALNGNGTLDALDQSDIKVRVTANNTVYDSDPVESSAFEVDNLAPSGLAAFAATAASTSQINLTWTAVTETNFSDYRISYSTVEANVGTELGSTWLVANDAALATITTSGTSVTGLTANTQYYFGIVAVDNFGNEEEATVVSATTSAVPGGGPVILLNFPSGGNDDNGNDNEDEPKDEEKDKVIEEVKVNEDIKDITKQIIDVVDQVKADQEVEKVVEKVASGEKLTTGEKAVLAEKKTVQTVENKVEEFFNILPATLIKTDGGTVGETPATGETGTTQTPEQAKAQAENNKKVIDSVKEIFAGAADADGDGISNARELRMGTNPLVNNQGTIKTLFATPSKSGVVEAGIGKLKVAAVSSKGFVLSGTAKPNSKVSVNAGGSVILTEADENGHFLVPVDLANAAVNDLVAVDTTVDGKTSKILAKVTESKTPQPTLSIEGKNVAQIEDFNAEDLMNYIASLPFKSEWVKKADLIVLEAISNTEYKDVVIASVDVKKGKSSQVLVSGTAVPGSTVVLAYKSVIYSSVVIADKNGKFTASLPKDLAAELQKSKDLKEVQHEFVAFSVNYKTNEISPFTKGLFKLFR